MVTIIIYVQSIILIGRSGHVISSIREQRSEDEGRKTEVGGQKTEAREQRSAAGRQRSEDRGRKTDYSCRKSDCMDRSFPQLF